MKTKIVAIGLAAGLGVLAAGALGADFLAERVMARQVDAALARPPFTGASHGAIRYSPWRGHLEIDDLAVTTDLPALRALHAGRVALGGVGPGRLFGFSGDLALSSVHADGVEAVSGDLHESAASLTLTGLRLAGGLAPEPLVSSRNPLSALFARLSVERAELAQAHLWTEAHDRDIALGTLSAGPIAKGRIAAVAATNAVATIAGGTLRGTVATLSLSGVDCVALRWIAAPEGAPGDGPFALIDSLALRTLSLADGRGVITADGLSLDGLRLRAGGDPDTASGTRLETLLRATSLERLELSGAAFRSSETPTDRASLAHLVLAGLRPGSIGKMTLETLALSTSRAVAHLGSLELDGLAYGRQMTPLGMPTFFADHLHLADLSAGVKPGAEVMVKDASFAMVGGLDDPRGGSFKVGPVTIPATAAAPLMLAGYNELTVEYDGETRYDAAASRLEARQHLVAQGAGTLSLSLSLGHYPAALEAHDPLAMSMQLMQAELEHFELRYDDASLADRLLKLYADSTGRGVAAIREEIIGRAETQRPALADKPLLLASLDAIEAFVRKPGALSLTLAPEKPVTLGMLMMLSRLKPDQALQLLGLSVR